MLNGKNEVQSRLQHFIALVENQFGVSIKFLTMNYGIGFTSPVYYGFKGIIHRTSCKETLDIRALMLPSSVKKKLWRYFVTHVFLLNKFSTILPSDKSAF
ncbi:hypothetical protein CR513_49085, partial [Mucuna pruriens]